MFCRSLEALRRRLSPGLPLSLNPTAPWERSCRSVQAKQAGTNTPISTDDQIDAPVDVIGGDLEE
jgi:hypothetical protein